MRKLLLAASIAASALVAAPASAAVLFSFQGGLPSPGAGFHIINDFEDATGITGSGFQIKQPPSDANGAPPANSSPSGTNYLSVLAGGSATINFGPVSAFQFDWGSIDDYNTLTIHFSGGSSQVLPGSNFINPANGDQVSPGTNGLFTVTGTNGEKFTGITLESSTNSFEVDNLAIAVPEPATWAMMIMGFGGVGALIRRRRTLEAIQTA